jgi:carboxymethylenebutenolidase
MRVYAAGPDVPASAVLLFPDVLGLHAEILAFVDRIGEQGFRCLAPDVYYREHRQAFRGIVEQDEMIAAGKRLRTSELADDIAALVRFATAGQPTARLATIGFCRGGSQAVLAAGVAPDTVVSTLAVYPTRLLQDSPDTAYAPWLPAVRAELRLFCPGDDPLFPRSDVEEIAQRLDASATPYQIRIYPNAAHGWNFSSRPEYNAHADRDTWEVAFDAWDRLLVRREDPRLDLPRLVLVADPQAVEARPSAT